MAKENDRLGKLFYDWRVQNSRNWADDKNDREQFLKNILKPVQNELHYSEIIKGKENPSGRKISAKEAYDLFQEFAEIQENKGYLFDASKSWAYAGRIAEMAKAPGTAQKLFLKSAETLEKLYDPTTNINHILDMQEKFRKGGNLKKAAEVLEKGGKDNTHAFYEAGEYSKAADSAPHDSPFGLRSLKKAGRFEELASAYDSISEYYTQKGNEKLASRFEANARKIRQKSLERKLTGSVLGLTLISGFFLISSNITGNAIADLTIKTTSFLGAGLLIVGLIGGFFWLRNRKK